MLLNFKMSVHESFCVFNSAELLSNLIVRRITIISSGIVVKGNSNSSINFCKFLMVRVLKGPGRVQSWGYFKLLCLLTPLPTNHLFSHALLDNGYLLASLTESSCWNMHKILVDILS